MTEFNNDEKYIQIQDTIIKLSSIDAWRIIRPDECHKLYPDEQFPDTHMKMIFIVNGESITFTFDYQSVVAEIELYLMKEFQPKVFPKVAEQSNP